jgi:hypothetical protein
VKRKDEVTYHSTVAFSRLEDGIEVLKRLSTMDPAPLGNRLILGNLRGAPGYAEASPVWRAPIVAALFEGSETAVRKFDTDLKAIASGLGLEVQSGDGARSAFETQFTDLAAGLNRTLVRSGEILIGLDSLPELLGILEGASEGGALIDVQVVDRGLALVMVCALAGGPGLPPVVRDVPVTVRISQAALGCGGRPYGIGIWNTPISGRVLGKARRVLKAIKHETDRPMILNPGKFFTLTAANGLPVWGWAFKLGLGLITRF